MCLPQFTRANKWNRFAPLTSRIDCLHAAGLAALLAVCGSTTQAQQRPDMDMLSFTVSSTLVNRGSSVSVDYNVENEGNWGTQNTWSDGIYLRDSTAAPSPSVAPLVDLPHNHFFSLLPGQSYSEFQPPLNPTRQVTIPPTPGLANTTSATSATGTAHRAGPSRRRTTATTTSPGPSR